MKKVNFFLQYGLWLVIILFIVNPLRILGEEKKEEIAKPAVVMKIYEVKKGDTLYSISRRFSLTVEDLQILNNLQKQDLQLGQLLVVSKI